MNESPLPASPVKVNLDFFDALRAVRDGMRVTKAEWNDPRYYGVLSNGRLKLHKPDGLFHDWIISDGDLFGEDWLIVSDPLNA